MPWRPWVAAQGFSLRVLDDMCRTRSEGKKPGCDWAFRQNGQQCSLELGFVDLCGIFCVTSYRYMIHVLMGWPCHGAQMRFHGCSSHSLGSNKPQGLIDPSPVSCHCRGGRQTAPMRSMSANLDLRTDHELRCLHCTAFNHVYLVSAVGTWWDCKTTILVGLTPKTYVGMKKTLPE